MRVLRDDLMVSIQVTDHSQIVWHDVAIDLDAIDAMRQVWNLVVHQQLARRTSANMQRHRLTVEHPQHLGYSRSAGVSVATFRQDREEYSDLDTTW
mgnify:CR=1 FL=1